MSKIIAMVIVVAVALFSIFPLTDTDIWWHLACAREWVTTWTPSREPIVNVHAFFQQTVAFVYNVGGAPLLVAFKSLLWVCVFTLFLRPQKNNNSKQLSLSKKNLSLTFFYSALFVLILFVFRYQFEIRPVVFSLIFLGVYWNILPRMACYGLENEEGRFGEYQNCTSQKFGFNFCSSFVDSALLTQMLKFWGCAIVVLLLQWFWCKCQGLYIFGPLFALLIFIYEWLKNRKLKKNAAQCVLVLQFIFVVLLFVIPFLHQEGLNLFLYPFGLLDRLLGLSPSAAVFASEIAENRSPFTLLIAGENVLQSMMIVILCVVGVFVALKPVLPQRTQKSSHRFNQIGENFVSWKRIWLCVMAVLALVAERNFVLFLPVFFAVVVPKIQYANFCYKRVFFGIERSKRISFCTCSSCLRLSSFFLLAFLLGLWTKSLFAYDASMIAGQRVPVWAVAWMKNHPHSGRLFNDDRAGGYLAFVNPSDSTFIDGRFILKTADFFERYLQYSVEPQMFLHDADSLNIDRVVLPLRYYARWNTLLLSLDSSENWHVQYRDSLFVVMDRTER